MAFLDNPTDLHESQTLEFKEAAGGLPDDLWETYSAFANTEGGEIVLGVREDRATHEFSIEGVYDADAAMDAFWATLRNRRYVERDIVLYDGVRAVTLGGKTLVLIEVPRAVRDEKPVRVYSRRDKAFVAWVRRGTGDYRATDADLRLMGYDNTPSADRLALERFGVDALCEDTIRHYRAVFSGLKPSSPWNADSDEDFLYHIGALAKGRGGALRPTQAGLLAFGREFEITNYLPHYLLDYREEVSGESRWDDRVVSQSGDWSGNLLDFYFLVTERLQRHFKMPFATDATGTRHLVRNELTEAVNEAVVNALTHAYYGQSSTVRVVLGCDGLEVSNPGSMLIDRDVAIAGGASESRNPTLMRIFGFIGASDRAGSGLQKIYATWSRLFDEEPRLCEQHAPAGVVLSLPLRSGVPAASHASASRVPALDDEGLVAGLADEPRGMTAREVSEAFGVSERVAQIHLRALWKQGRVDRVRDGRALRYLVGGEDDAVFGS